MIDTQTPAQDKSCGRCGRCDEVVVLSEAVGGEEGKLDR